MIPRAATQKVSKKPQSKISRKVMSKIYRDLMIMSVTILENKSVIVYNIKWN